MDAVALAGRWRWRLGAGPWSPWRANAICGPMRQTLGYFLAQGAAGSNLAAWAAGQTVWAAAAIAVGAGDPSWDTLAQPPAFDPAGQTLLTNELGRKPLAVVGYRQPDGSLLPPGGLGPQADIGAPVFQAFWSATELVGQGIRELGLFGGRTAGSILSPNAGLLLSYLRFPVLQRPATDPYSLTVQVEISFQV